MTDQSLSASIGHMRDRHIDGRTIRALREQRAMRQPELADRANISLTYLKEIEGKVSDPAEPTRQPAAVVAYAIAHALGVDIDAFSTVTGEDEAAA